MLKDKNQQVQGAAEDAQRIAEEKRQAALRKSVAAYQKPKSEAIAAQLERYKDQKFGLMVHWGLYNQLGIKESWPLVGQDEWARWQFKEGTSLREVREMYAQLHRGFLPLRFDPKEWAELAFAAGFRYLVFTAKHHDGFCMWDTATTDYKVTGKDVPWREHPYADITRALFDAFREKGMEISLYYSRADFDCPYYWEPGYAEREDSLRLPSYKPEEKPELWENFQKFVFAQLDELVSNYGKINSLWYDGGCDGVALGLPEMTERLREKQPWMLSVIRSQRGYEDVITPELFVPDTPLDAPFEVCTVMGKPRQGEEYISFGYTYDQDYMSAKEVAHLLLDVVAKGGNLALNLAPQPDGRLPERAVRELHVLAKWMAVFGDAIHGTRAVAPYRTDKWAFSATKDGKRVNAFYLWDEGEIAPACLTVPYDGEVRTVRDMRSGRSLAFERRDGGICIMLPAEQVGRAGDIADCYVIERC